MSQLSEAQQALVQQLLNLPEWPQATAQDFAAWQEHFLGQRERLLAFCQDQPKPFYLIDQPGLAAQAIRFRSAMEQHIPGCQLFFAMKSNDHPEVVKQLITQGIQIDVSSGRELEIALAADAPQIIFTGPGKSAAELELALTHRARVTINLDSFAELELLGQLTQARGDSIRAGVRVFTSYHGAWNKFGIPLAELGAFWAKAERLPGVELQGIQFHYSSHPDATGFARMIEEVGRHLAEQLGPEQRSLLRYIDCGGGFMPSPTYAYHPWATPQGSVLKTAAQTLDHKLSWPKQRYLSTGVSPEAYASGIAEAIAAHFAPLVSAACRYYFEPGKILSHHAMAIVLRVADVKQADSVITDGGINLIGDWEWYTTRYFPIYNLTHPAAAERPATIYGPLCTPADLWGFDCYAERFEPGDVLLIPAQGSYTYSLAQNFIKPIADAVVYPG